ncbi:ATP-dependent nuclease [Serratia marcescens]|uniref:ATP-dependent nuclease n=1 Tax=Serratia marcescens TaxID=615 RepID=UPI001F152EA8|nr:AAA family ATPase [Serratia marcescens]MDP8612678.1 AAA family ATPase [Serratia marcescens]MDP8647907.1 AAA family ATPase [Serratia marcescens]MDP8682269.1 AAA family ATPase [Serratia marcescens]
MFIRKVALVNYRNFKGANFYFDKGINTIIGENASGKTNLFRAIRLLLDSSMPRYTLKLQEGDFNRSIGEWRGHWIIISAEFDDIAKDEASQSLFLHGAGNAEAEIVSRATYSLIFRPKSFIRQSLSKITSGDRSALEEILRSITIDDYETILVGKITVDLSNPSVYKKIVGDFENIIFPQKLNHPELGVKLPNILNIPNEVCLTYIKALRDVVSDFHNNKTNPLLTLLKRKSGEISTTDFQPIADLVRNLNNEIENLPDICAVNSDIATTIKDAVGDTYSPKGMSIKSSLSEESNELFQSLKLFVAESSDGYEGAIHEMSLGGANLLYLTLKLLEFKYQHANQSIANFLLIEEPEAHIHTHIQKSLFENIKYHNTQIIYSTHSSNISEISNIKNMNIIGFVNNNCEVFQPSKSLSDVQCEFIQRYLDAIRSNLLFARSVILVEGDAEELLIPTLIKKVIGLSLDEIGISLINIRSTGFENVALLFSDERIKKKCSIVTDLDEAFFDITIPEGADNDNDEIKVKKKAAASQKSGAERKVRLQNFSNNNDWVEVFFAEHTFEVDFIKSGNKYYLDKIVDDVYKQAATIEIAKNELNSSDISISGVRALTMANYQGKGWFALTLGKVIDFKTAIPDYIFDAIKFSHGDFNRQLKYKILEHRYKSVVEHVSFAQELISKLNEPEDIQLKKEWSGHIKAYEDGLNAFTPKWNMFDILKGDVDALKIQMMNDLPNENKDILRRI